MNQNPEYILLIQGPVISIGTNYTLRRNDESLLEINAKDYILSNIDNFKKYYNKVIFSSYIDTPEELIHELRKRGVHIFLKDVDIKPSKFRFIDTHRLNSKMLQIKGTLSSLIEFQNLISYDDFIIRIRTDILINFDILFEDIKNSNNLGKEVILTHLHRYNKFNIKYSYIPDFVYVIKSNILKNILLDLNSNEYHEQIHHDFAHSVSKYYQIYSVPILKVQIAIERFIPKKLLNLITNTLDIVNNIIFSSYQSKKIGLLSKNFSRQILWRESAMSEQELEKMVFLSKHYAKS